MLNPFVQAQFLISCARLQQLPQDDAREVAFAGRSNAGKSSALNALCGRRQLARVSKTPGRTQLINLFALPNGNRLADLPGYGYANVPAAVRASWGRLIGGYMEQRRNLCAIVLIMDIRHPLTDYDQQMLAWTRANERPCQILLTKADKLSFGAAKAQLLKVQKDVAELGVSADVLLYSAISLQGLEEARARINQLLNEAGAPAEDRGVAPGDG